MILAFVIIYMVPAVVTYYISVDLRDFYKDNFNVIIAIIIAIRVFRAFIDIYLGLEFLTLFKYFIKKKTRALYYRGLHLSHFNSFMIRWIYLNFGLKAFHAFCTLTVLTMF